MLKITESIREAQPHWGHLLAWLFSPCDDGKEADKLIALHRQIWASSIRKGQPCGPRAFYESAFSGSQLLRNKLNEEWTAAMERASAPNHHPYPPLLDLPITSEVGALCLRTILQADYMIDQFPDTAHSTALDGMLMVVAAQQCAVFYYG